MIKETTKADNKAHHAVKDAKAKGLDYDTSKLKTLGKAGGKSSFQGMTVVLGQPNNIFYAIYGAIPAEVQRYVDLIIAEGENGAMSIADSNEAWIGSSNYDSSGKNGYKQDVYEFLPTYFKAGTGCTKNLLNRGYTKEQVDQFLSFEVVSGVNL